MAKERDARPCHHCVEYDVETGEWKTACGLRLDRAARAEVVLADERQHVTCKKCKETAHD